MEDLKNILLTETFITENGDIYTGIYGCSTGLGIDKYNGRDVSVIEDHLIIIEESGENYIKGIEINVDFSTNNCYIITFKGKTYFQYESTLAEAELGATQRYYWAMAVDDRLNEFIKEFPDWNASVPFTEMYRWHNLLTKSCEEGRIKCSLELGYDPNDKTKTIKVRDLLDFAKDKEFGDIIYQLIDKYKELENKNA